MISESLLDWAIQQDRKDGLYAFADQVYGSYSSDLVEININVDEEVICDVEEYLSLEPKERSSLSAARLAKLEKSFRIYFQVHNHELFHFYQFLSLPLFSVFCVVRKRYLEYQTALMLQCFEAGGEYRLSEHFSPLAVLKSSPELFPESWLSNSDAVLGAYKLQTELWNSESEGLSPFQLVEGMAHVASLQLSDDPDIDVLELEQVNDYVVAYKLFSASANFGGIETRWKYLLFLYYGHFSLQTPMGAVVEDPLIAIKVFNWLCDRTELYLTLLSTLKKRYEKYSHDRLVTLNRWNQLSDLLQHASTQQLASIYAFFELIEAINDDIQKQNPHPGQEVIEMQPFTGLASDHNIHVEDLFQLGLLVIFPERFYSVRETYDAIDSLQPDGQSFSYEKERGFYKFIRDCKNILNPASPSIECCEEHGKTSDVRRLLNCDNEDSVAFRLSALTGKAATDLFLFE